MKYFVCFAQDTSRSVGRIENYMGD